MPRRCESGVEHHTYGDIRGCSVCQSNGAAARIHAAYSNEAVVDPAAATTAEPTPTSQLQATPDQPKAKPRRR